MGVLVVVYRFISGSEKTQVEREERRGPKTW